MTTEELKNAKQMPEVFYFKHMVPGVCAYENENVYIDLDTMKRAAASMVGKPIYVEHQKVNVANIHDADGFITDSFYNELDGWLWAKGVIISDAGHQALSRKWSLSNGYLPKEWDGAGQHLNVDYKRKIRNIEFTHLAIVPNPRYEESNAFTPEAFKAYNDKKRAELKELQNSKPNTEGNAIMFFRTKKEEIKAGETILDTDFAEIKNDDGTIETVTVGDLKKAKLEAKEAEKLNAKKNEKPVGDDEEVEVDGEKVNMADLKECYKNNKKEKKNSEEADAAEKKKAKEKEEAEEKENARKDAAEKLNAKNQMEELLNAGNKNRNSKSEPVVISTMQDRVARGQARYGKTVKK